MHAKYNNMPFSYLVTFLGGLPRPGLGFSTISAATDALLTFALDASFSLSFSAELISLVAVASPSDSLLRRSAIALPTDTRCAWSR